jgi:hypothetical protein
LEIGLLKSHLFNDPLWGQYKGWSQGLWFYFQALATFKETAASVLAEHTDGGFADENMNPVTAGHNSEVRAERPGTMLTVTLLESVFKWLVKAVTEEWAGQKQGGIQDEARLKELGDHIRLDPERGELRWGHFHAIAFCRGREPECKQAVIEACRRLLGSPEAKHLKNSYQKLKEHGATLLNTLQIIKLGILILGECSVCKRFRRF